MYKIIDNYINKEDHLILKTIMESDEFPWFYVEKKVSTDKGLTFNHCSNINATTKPIAKIKNVKLKKLDV